MSLLNIYISHLNIVGHLATRIFPRLLLAGLFEDLFNYVIVVHVHYTYISFIFKNLINAHA